MLIIDHVHGTDPKAKWRDISDIARLRRHVPLGQRLTGIERGHINKVQPIGLAPFASGIGASGDAGQHIADSWVDIATDAMCFLAGRMAKDESFQQAVLAYDDICDLEAVQAVFLSATSRDYSI